jgi:hypothetical protein
LAFIKKTFTYKGTHYVEVVKGLFFAAQGEEFFIESITLIEVHLYGSARIGMRQTNTIVSKRSFTASIESNTGQFINHQVLANQSGNEPTPQTMELSSLENNYTIERAQRDLGQ